jgi:hypothetical protein
LQVAPPAAPIRRARAIYRADLALQSPEPEKAAFHLTPEQIQTFAAGRQRELDPVDLKIAEGHLELCEQCSHKIQLLRGLTATEKAVAAPITADAKSNTVRAPLFAALRRRLAVPGVAAALPIALASGLSSAAVVLLVAGLVWRSSRPVGVPPAPAFDSAALQKQLEDRIAATAQTTATQIDRSLTAGNRQTATEIASRFDQRFAQVNRQLTQMQQQYVALAAQPRGAAGSTQIMAYVETANGVERAPESVAMAFQSGGKLTASPTLQGLASSHTVTPSFAGGPELRLIAPVGTAIKTPEAALRWSIARPGSGTVNYEVIITDEVRHQPIAAMPHQQSDQTDWRVADGLRPGGLYSWKVVAHLPNGKQLRAPASGKAKFRVLTAEQRTKIEREERQYAGAPITLAVLYADAGLLDDALQTLQPETSSDNPNKVQPRGEIVNKLIENIQNLRR